MNNDTTINGTIMTDEQLFAAARKWANGVRRKAQSNAQMFSKGKKGPYTYSNEGKSRYKGKTEKKLSDGMSYVIKKQYGDIDHVSFKIPIHGIFRALGVGNGQPSDMSADSEKSHKQKSYKTYIRRTKSDWVNKPIEDNLDGFATIIANYYGDKILLNFQQQSKIQNL